MHNLYLSLAVDTAEYHNIQYNCFLGLLHCSHSRVITAQVTRFASPPIAVSLVDTFRGNRKLLMSSYRTSTTGLCGCDYSSSTSTRISFFLWLAGSHLFFCLYFLFCLCFSPVGAGPGSLLDVKMYEMQIYLE